MKHAEGRLAEVAACARKSAVAGRNADAMALGQVLSDATISGFSQGRRSRATQASMFLSAR